MNSGISWAPAYKQRCTVSTQQGAVARRVFPAQTQDARPEQSSKGVHSRSSGIWGLMSRDHFPCSTEGCITSKKAWMAKAVSQSWDPFVPWKRENSESQVLAAACPICGDYGTAHPSPMTPNSSLHPVVCHPASRLTCWHREDRCSRARDSKGT